METLEGLKERADLLDRMAHRLVCDMTMFPHLACRMHSLLVKLDTVAGAFAETLKQLDQRDLDEWANQALQDDAIGAIQESSKLTKYYDYEFTMEDEQGNCTLLLAVILMVIAFGLLYASQVIPMFYPVIKALGG